MIYEILSTGRENARTARDLCGVLNLTGRELTSAIERERRSGKPICASCSPPQGYYIASDKQNMYDYCDSLQRRTTEIQATRSACLETIESLPDRTEGD